MSRALLAAAVALGGAWPMAVAAQDAQWRESPQLFLANSGPRGRVTYHEGDYILRVPIVWALAARIDSPVTFEFEGDTETLTAGSVIPAVMFNESGPAENGIVVFCTPSRLTEKVKNAGGLAQLLNSARESLTDSQKCLKDADDDGSFDQMLMVGEGENDFRQAKAISPVAYELLPNAPVSGTEDNEVTMSVWSVGETKARIYLNIVQRRQTRNFDSLTSGRFRASKVTTIDLEDDLGKRLTIFGTEFEFVDFDTKAETITLKWPENAKRDARPAIPSDLYIGSR